MSYETSVVIMNEHSQVLTRQSERPLKLPGVRVEPGRAGISLVRAVRDQLDIEVFCLVLPTSTDGAPPPLRLQSTKRAAPDGFRWVDACDCDVDCNHTQISQVLSKFSPTDQEFGQYAWYSAVQDWLTSEISKFGYVIRALEQWNGRVGGVLLRVVTDGPQFWFKAVSDFNARESGIAQLLASKHPSHFPKVIATQPAWNAFLLEHLDGVELYDCDDLATWKAVARLLAEIQMDWVGQGDAAAHAGAADLRAESLIQKIPAFLDHIDDAMARQPKTPPPTLTRVDLDELGNTLYWLCGEVAALPFANGLANADFSPHNTLITDRGPVFIDWAEACVSLPMIAGEYMWNRMAVECPHRSSWKDTLRATYLSRWATQYRVAPVARAAQLLPAFSIFAVAMFYHERECHGPSPYDSYLRSLTRKLNHEVRKLPLHSDAVQV